MGTDSSRLLVMSAGMTYFILSVTMATVSRAMTSSSLVGTTITSTLLSVVTNFAYSP